MEAKKFMVAKGYAAKTIDTRLNIVLFLLNFLAMPFLRHALLAADQKPASP